MFISPAYAQGAGGAGFEIAPLLPLILIFVIFYFLLIRPQQKRMKKHREMVASLRRGDRVVTAGGLLGTVTKVVNDNELQIELSEGVRVRVVRATIQDVLSKTEPAEGEAKPEAANESGDAKPAGEAKPRGMMDRLTGKKSD